MDNGRILLRGAWVLLVMAMILLYITIATSDSIMVIATTHPTELGAVAFLMGLAVFLGWMSKKGY